jgi:calcium permeable stress-gated cation channel
MIILLIFTVLIHLSLNEALSPLLYSLPKTLCVEGMNDQPSADGIPLMNMNELGVMDVEKYGSEFEFDGPDFSEHGEQSSRAIEGAEGAASLMGKSLTSFVISKVKSKVDVDSYVEKVDFWTRWISPDPDVKPNFLIKWLHPEIYADYTILRQMLTVELPQDIYSEEYARNAYYSPSIVRPTPSLWIPRDPGGISQQEVAHTSKVNPITDEGAWLNEKNRVVIDLGATSPIIIERFR